MGRADAATEYDAEELRIALCLAEILQELDPEGWVDGNAATEEMALDGHWFLPEVARRLRAQLLERPRTSEA